jgi:predicted ATPase/5S rRNA maturation endonuclease (ribonuclease M5)
MKIKSIKLQNNPVLGNFEIDFTDKNGNPVDSIILAGENGSGKTTILDIIFELSQYRFRNNYPAEIREFDLILDQSDLELLRQNEQSSRYFSRINSPVVKVSFDYSKESWNQVEINVLMENDWESVQGGILSNQELKKIFRSIYSDAEISFTPNQIRSVTAKTLDEEQKSSIRSGNNLSTEIAQLLIDIKTLDDSDFTEWAKQNIGKEVDETKLEPRIKRFKSAFSFMFPNLELTKVQNFDGHKKVTFEQYGNDVFLEDLSSGEKQIVFRGGFMLKDQQSNKGIVALIDEPEISLHPDWQLKVLEFYKRLFKDENGDQTSQLFVATHSPFIIHNYTRNKDKVIILNKDDAGNITIKEGGSYYGWKTDQMVQEAFKLDNFLESNESESIVITEGKTDATILRSAWEKLYPQREIPFIIVPAGIEIDENKRSGGADNTRRTLELISNISEDRVIIGLFDNDKEGNEQYKGLSKKIFEPYDDESICRKHQQKEIYGLLLPVPENRSEFVSDSDLTLRFLEIEHFFSDDLLDQYDLKGETFYNAFFKIDGNKTRFADESENFDTEIFSNFELIFDEISDRIN